MSWLTTAVCDECGRQKGESNGWVVAEQFGNKNTLNDPLGIVFWPWTKKVANGGYSHLCGMECAQKRLARFLLDNPREPECKSESPGTEAAS